MAENPFARASLAGAVDLSALKAKAEQAKSASNSAGANPAAGAAGSSANPTSPTSPIAPTASPSPNEIPVSSLVVDGGVENLREFLELSNLIPVLVDFKTASVPGSSNLTATLERIIPQLDGKVILCRIDADKQPQILEAFQMRQGGVAVALVKGQPVPLISAELDEAEIQARLARLLEVSAQQGMTARAVVMDAAAAAAQAQMTQAQQLPPRHQKAFEFIDAGDYDSAINEYEAALREMPTDSLATAGLAQTKLLKRVHGLDFEAVFATQPAAEDASALQETLTKADALVASGNGQLAFELLLDRFAIQFAERDALRPRLLEYFTVLGNEDPSVIAARKRLTALMY
jgi:putative thioredoxin